MKHLFIIGLLFILSHIGQAQSFNFKRIHVSSIEALQSKEAAEKFTYDYPIGVSTDYFPNRKSFSLAQPITYKKDDKTFYRETSYYFSTPDSIVRLIEYQWQGGDGTTEDNFNKVVEQNKKLIAKYFKYTGKNTAATDIKAANTVWENNSVYVEQFFIPGSLRIRVLVSWK